MNSKIQEIHDSIFFKFQSNIRKAKKDWFAFALLYILNKFQVRHVQSRYMSQSTSTLPQKVKSNTAQPTQIKSMNKTSVMKPLAPRAPSKTTCSKPIITTENRIKKPLSSHNPKDNSQEDLIVWQCRLLQWERMESLLDDALSHLTLNFNVLFHIL